MLRFSFKLGKILTYFFFLCLYRWLEWALLLFSIILFSAYIIYDTQLLTGKGKHALSIDDYVLGAVMLYIDIVLLFLQILKLLGKIMGEKD